MALPSCWCSYDDGSDGYVSTGYGPFLAEQLANGLTVHFNEVQIPIVASELNLSQPVKTVQWGEGGCSVISRTGAVFQVIENLLP